MKKSEKIKIVFTGGHAATTAISVVEEILRRKLGWKVYWIGAKSSVEGQAVSTLESEVFPALGVTLHSIKAGRLQRKFSLWTIPSLLKIPLGFFQAFTLLFRIKPKLVLSFGAYTAFPVVVSAYILRIPVVVHEQTVAAGRANRASGVFARKVALARKESQRYFPRGKCVVVGNPILSEIAKIKPKRNMGSSPTVFITCGSRGSQRINEAVDGILERLLSSYRIIHQTGPIDYPNFLKRKKSLSGELSKNYVVESRIDPLKIATIYAQADMVIARAGANTVSEIVATGRPSVLIPIPWSYLNEQAKNAQAAQELGIAKIVTQDSLSPASLLEAIEEVRQDWESMVKNSLKKESPDTHASARLVELLEAVLG
jgi:UDP-N-acetylglucosamine--N-acetylmuramyl-(pentapeptide) pyrophosphoryl-undecaprenol N-acetylglucosamine transferase